MRIKEQEIRLILHEHNDDDDDDDDNDDDKNVVVIVVISPFNVTFFALA